MATTAGFAPQLHNISTAPFQKPFSKTSAATAAPPATSPVTPVATTISTSTSDSMSPISPRGPAGTAFQFPTRQLRPPKSPLYVPCVLRPTERPIRQSPPKNIGESVLDSADSSWSSGRGSNHSARRSIAESVDSRNTRMLRTATEDWGDDSSSECVTGPPSMNHWQADNSTVTCTELNCQKTFTFFNRRHHCRRCGGIFCSEHSSHLVRLNQHALFHPRAALYRSCTRCYHSYRDWEARRLSRSNSDCSQEAGTLIYGSSNLSGLGIANKKNNPHAQASINGSDQQKVGSVAASVPRDWAWSTF